MCCFGVFICGGEGLERMRVAWDAAAACVCVVFMWRGEREMRPQRQEKKD